MAVDPSIHNRRRLVRVQVLWRKRRHQQWQAANRIAHGRRPGARTSISNSHLLESVYYGHHLKCERKCRTYATFALSISSFALPSTSSDPSKISFGSVTFVCMFFIQWFVRVSPLLPPNRIKPTTPSIPLTVQTTTPGGGDQGSEEAFVFQYAAAT